MTQGPTIVFLHGSGASSLTWQQVTERLPEYHCIALDLPGHGEQIDDPGPEMMSVGDYATQVHGELVRRGLSEVCLAGHSLGSAIALHMAVTAPSLVGSLVLIGSGARLRVAPQLLETARLDPDRATQLLDDLGVAPGHKEMADRYRQMERPTAPGVLYRDLAACNAFDMMADLGRITQPVLIITGEFDKLTPPKYATYLNEHLGHSTLAMIPNAGHYVPLEEPDAVAEALHSWLAATKG